MVVMTVDMTELVWDKMLVTTLVYYLETTTAYMMAETMAETLDAVLVPTI
jgi:hypothetical protein